MALKRNNTFKLMGNEIRNVPKPCIGNQIQIDKSASHANFVKLKRIIKTFNTTLSNDLKTTQKRKSLGMVFQ